MVLPGYREGCDKDFFQKQQKGNAISERWFYRC
jgi:hypothetical protein